MSGGWYAMSSHFSTDPKIEAVGEEVGAQGPLAAVVLMCWARQQNAGGKVEGTFRTLAHEIYGTREEAKSALRALVSAGVLRCPEESETAFKADFPAWPRWQDAFRKARKRAEERAEEPHEQANVRTSPSVSGASPDESLTVQDTTQQDKDPPNPPKGEFEDWISHYCEVTGKKAKGSKAARRAFNARRGEGRSLEELKRATVGCHSDAFNRQHGHDVPETILRDSKVERYIQLGSKSKPSADERPEVKAWRERQEERWAERVEASA